ncbi:Hypothetical predicted protein [Mytilus galloprovincialis]|uniref:Uncharacterized protein n=1 Tax=Mytilus galloprovincialis TaxID=29158 RepID=A0A8B6DVP1_MYTGA|nr:Hypothetical predicted protein [Mytilus galloprovincialis]
MEEGLVRINQNVKVVAKAVTDEVKYTYNILETEKELYTPKRGPRLLQSDLKSTVGEGVNGFCRQIYNRLLMKVPRLLQSDLQSTVDEWANDFSSHILNRLLMKLSTTSSVRFTIDC